MGLFEVTVRVDEEQPCPKGCSRRAAYDDTDDRVVCGYNLDPRVPLITAVERIESGPTSPDTCSAATCKARVRAPTRTILAISDFVMVRPRPVGNNVEQLVMNLSDGKLLGQQLKLLSVVIHRPGHYHSLHRHGHRWFHYYLNELQECDAPKLVRNCNNDSVYWLIYQRC